MSNDSTGRDDLARDAHLSAALRHAPDRDAAPPSALSRQILQAARRAAQASNGAATSNIPWWRRVSRAVAAALDALRRPAAGAAFASLALATVIGLMWREGPPPEAVRSVASDEAAPTRQAPPQAARGKSTAAGESRTEAPAIAPQDAAAQDAAPLAATPPAPTAPTAPATPAAAPPLASPHADTRVTPAPAAPSADAMRAPVREREEAVAPSPARAAARRDAPAGALAEQPAPPLSKRRSAPGAKAEQQGPLADAPDSAETPARSEAAAPREAAANKATASSSGAADITTTDSLDAADASAAGAPDPLAAPLGAFAEPAAHGAFAASREHLTPLQARHAATRDWLLQAQGLARGRWQRAEQPPSPAASELAAPDGSLLGRAQVTHDALVWQAAGDATSWRAPLPPADLQRLRAGLAGLAARPGDAARP